MIQIFRRPWYCLQMHAEAAYTLKSSFVSAANRTSSSSCSIPKIAYYIHKAEYIFERGH